LVSAGHSPNLETVVMVEKVLSKSDDYPTRMQLYRRLPKKMHYSTFRRIIDYLIVTNRIELNEKTIVYIHADEKLKKYLDTFIELK
jgi:hypothetical protein